MIDEIAIQQLINKYTEGASRADYDQVASVYAPDGVWNLPVYNLSFKGRDAITKGMSDFLVAMDYLIQINSPAWIQIDGDTATARSTIREGAKFKGKDESVEILGFYNDELVRTPEGWLFASRTFNLVAMNSVALVPPAQPA